MSVPLRLDDAAPAAPSFVDLGVPAPMAAALARRGVAEPFPIQAATIPDALAGRDLCGGAPTGSGKTIAFGIPLVLGVGKAKPRRPRGLVLVPTCELAAQVAHELQQLSNPRGPRVETFYGGVGFPKQMQALRRGVDIAVACPGRLADLLNQGCADLSEVSFVVVDEADRMADMGFLPEVRRILDQCAQKRQTLLFSATLDGDVDVLIKRYQRNPVRHEFVRDDEDASRATHHFWTVTRTARVDTTVAVIRRAGPTVVFCRTKRGADRLASQLDGAGVAAAAIHGDRSQSQRDRALRSFHRGEVLALVATDVAARGIHVDDVACVIHYDPPQEAKDYVHRSGRTARAGASGLVVSLVLPDLRRDVMRLQRELGHDVGLAPAEPDALGQDRPTPPTPPTPLRAERLEATGAPRRPSGAARRKAKRHGDGRPSDARAEGGGNRSTAKKTGRGPRSAASRPQGPSRSSKGSGGQGSGGQRSSDQRSRSGGSAPAGTKSRTSKSRRSGSGRPRAASRRPRT